MGPSPRSLNYSISKCLPPIYISYLQHQGQNVGHSGLLARTRFWLLENRNEYILSVNNYFKDILNSTLFFYFKIFFSVYLFLRQRERQSMNRGWAEREGDTESETGSGLWAVSTGAQCGARTHRPRDHDLSRSRTLNRRSHPGAPNFFLF